MARMATDGARSYVTAVSVCAACAPSFDADTFEIGPGAEPGRERCSASLAPHDVQGGAGVSALSGESVDVAGVVTLALPPGGERPGFFMQSPREAGGERASAGLFVALPGQPPPRAGRHVRVRGTVGGAEGSTELYAVERLDECGLLEVTPEPLDMGELEAVEAWQARWVRAIADWALLDVSQVLRDGSVVASPRGRLYGNGHVLGGAPSAERWTIQPAAHPAASDPLGAASAPRLSPRLGAARDELVGVLEVSSGVRRLYTAERPTWPSQAPAAPARAPGTSVRVVGLNLDNYFLALDARGARSDGELLRQREKLVATLVALDADVLALTELENRGAESLAHLLVGLDAALDPGLRYTFSETPAPGVATLRAGIAHRPARVRARAEAWFDDRSGFRRAPLFQAFDAPGYRFTLGVVHLPSKLCDGQPEIIPSEGCGQRERAEEAELLSESARALSASAPLEPLLLLGDFNADTLETPIVALRSTGFVDLLDRLPAHTRYSYVFEGRANLLDHALAQGGVARLTRGAAIWHINADEPFFLGYSLDNPPAEYRPDARRSSDHDPIIVDLGL